MTVIAFTPDLWGTHDIQDATYVSRFEAADSAALDRIDSVAVETELPGRGTTFVRPQPDPRRFILSIYLQAPTQETMETLKQWFDPLAGQQYLTALDGAGASRRILAFPEKMWRVSDSTGNYYKVQLLASTPYWEETTAQTPAATNVTTSGQTFVLTNPGNTRAYPSFVITPNTVKAHANDYIARRRLVIANRSELPITDPVGDGWPVNVVDTTLNTDALNTAGKLQTDLDDLRVVLNGAFINRWPDPATDNAATRLWCNLQFSPRKTATKKMPVGVAFGTSAVPIFTEDSNGFTTWPQSGFFVIEDECCQYDGRTANSLNVTMRGARATTAAAHADGTACSGSSIPFSISSMTTRRPRPRARRITVSRSSTWP